MLLSEWCLLPTPLFAHQTRGIDCPFSPSPGLPSAHVPISTSISKSALSHPRPLDVRDPVSCVLVPQSLAFGIKHMLEKAFRNEQKGLKTISYSPLRSSVLLVWSHAHGRYPARTCRPGFASSSFTQHVTVSPCLRNLGAQ